MGVDTAAVRARFPILERRIDGRGVVYLDSASTAQKPLEVIEAMSSFMRQGYAPIHRSAYRLAAEATEAFDGARRAVARFINASHDHEVVFTKNATEGLNLVAAGWGRATLRPGDAVVLTLMEHHANIVPWQMLAAERGIELRWVPLTDTGELDVSGLPRLLDGARAFSFTAMSNVLGTCTPVAELCRAAHDAGAIAIVDGCQYVPHDVTDVQAWGADFVAFSGHKLYGPSGIGVLWGRDALLDAMPPVLGGGGMITDVRLDGFGSAGVPARFEAGTPPIVEAVGLGAAIEFVSALGMAAIRAHERRVTAYAMTMLAERFGDEITLFGPTDIDRRGAIVSFSFGDIHPHDLSQVLDAHNVCVRAGHHCAKPLMRVLGAAATVRASFAVHTDTDDVDALADALDSATGLFGR